MSDNTLLIEVEKREFLGSENAYYQMDGNPRGFCVIINMVKTTVEDKTTTEEDKRKTKEKGKKKFKLVEDRTGAQIDQNNISALFASYNFRVEVKDCLPIVDQSHEQIKKNLQKIARKITSSHQCLFLFLMAHGKVEYEKVECETVDDKTNEKKKEVVGYRVKHQFQDVKRKSKSSEYISEIFDKIHCPNLAGKPKIFVIQTCFGGEQMRGPYQITGTDPKKYKKGPTYDGPARYDPAHETSEMLWALASLEGYNSWRSSTKGAYFIQAMYNAMSDHKLKKESLDIILKKVSMEVMITKVNGEYRQQPEVISRMSKTLMFNPGLIKAEAFSEPPLYPRRPDIHKVDGTFVWPLRIDKTDSDKLPKYIVVNSDALSMHLHSDKYIKEIQPKSNIPINSLIGFKAGISIGLSNRHLAILKKKKGYTAALLSISSEDAPFWEIKDVKFEISNPLALCEVNKDGIGILCGVEGYKADFYIFSRLDILEKPRPAKVERFEMFYDVKAGDLVVYHAAKIYIASTFLSSVLVFNLASERTKSIATHRYNGRFNEMIMPCMIGRDARLTIIADELGIRVCYDKTNDLVQCYVGKNIRHAWYNSKHLVLAEKKNIFERETVNTLPARPGFTSASVCTYDTIYNAIWTIEDGGIVLAGIKTTKISIQIFNDTETSKKIELSVIEGSIATGLAVSPNEHVIITTHVEDQLNKLWRLYTGEDGTCEEVHDFPDNCQPLTLFTINHNSYGVVRKQIPKGQTSIEIRDKRTHFVVKLLAICHEEFTIHDSVCFTPFREFVISNNTEGTVRQYDEDGTLIQSFGEEGVLQELNSIFVDQNDIIYVLCQDGMHYFDKKVGKWLRLKKSEITGASMGCYDRHYVYILHTGGKTSVTRYNISIESQCKETKAAQTSMEDIQYTEENQLNSKSSISLDPHAPTKRENAEANQSRSRFRQNIRPQSSKTDVTKKKSPEKQPVRPRSSKPASTQMQSAVGQRFPLRSSTPSPTKEITVFTDKGSKKVPPTREKKTK